VICSAAVRLDEGVDLNLGDEALTACLALGISRACPNARVTRMVRVRGHNVELQQNERPLHLVGLAREIARADVVVLGGGTLLQNDRGLLLWQAILSAFAHVLRKPVVIAAVGAEGLRPLRYRLAARYICRNASAISVRDHNSSDVVQRVSGREVDVAADPVLLTHSSLKGAWLPPLATQHLGTKPTIAVNLTRVAPPQLIEALADRLARAISAGSQVIGVAMDRRADHDVAALRQLGDALGWPPAYRILPSETGWQALCKELSAADVCIGMRLHFMLLATIVSRPVVAITSLPKTIAFAQEFGIAQIATDATTIDLRNAIEAARPPEADTLAAMGKRTLVTIRQVLAAAKVADPSIESATQLP
jgi:polysaccharide pyruvyl transferase WcaK-like protein